MRNTLGNILLFLLLACFPDCLCHSTSGSG
jgi:hypothetical protein